jgi:hypothetical protein
VDFINRLTSDTAPNAWAASMAFEVRFGCREKEREKRGVMLIVAQPRLQMEVPAARLS